MSPAEHVSRKLSCRQSRRTVHSTLNVPTMKHGTTGIIRFWNWPIARIASKILHHRSKFTISNNFKVKALKKEERMRTMLKGPEKFLEDAFNRADKRLELRYLTDSGLLFFEGIRFLLLSSEYIDLLKTFIWFPFTVVQCTVCPRSYYFYLSVRVTF